MLLVIAMAVIGAFGLMWHQEAVDELDFLLHRSPDLADLSRSMSRIPESLFSSLDLRQPAAVQQQRQVYLSQIDEARDRRCWNFAIALKYWISIFSSEIMCCRESTSSMEI